MWSDALAISSSFASFELRRAGPSSVVKPITHECARWWNWIEFSSPSAPLGNERTAESIIRVPAILGRRTTFSATTHLCAFRLHVHWRSFVVGPFHGSDRDGWWWFLCFLILLLSLTLQTSDFPSLPLTDYRRRYDNFFRSDGFTSGL